MFDLVTTSSTKGFYLFEIQEEKNETEVAIADHDITCSIYHLLVPVEVEGTQIEFSTDSGVAPRGHTGYRLFWPRKEPWTARPRSDLHSSGADMCFAIWVYHQKRLV